MKRIIFLLAYSINFLIVSAQEIDSAKQDEGTFTFHARSFFMSTINKSELSDYYALGIGAGVGYESPEIKNFSVKLSGFFIYNAWSSNLARLDPITNSMNRYEIGLFDIEDPTNHNDLDRLEELYIQYRFHHSTIQVGKLILNTPFINPQDGRMRPTIVQGLWFTVNELKNTKIEFGWINEMSPRSTVRWSSVRNTIGLYPSGVNEVGVKSDYLGNLKSKGIGLIGVTNKIENVSIALWNTFIENISNTVFTQIDIQKKIEHKRYYAATQLIRQDGIGNGGNSDPNKQYMNPKTFTNTFGIRLGVTNKRMDANINYTRISDNGRFLMPREWGRDPFFTFLPRERNEGFGDVHAYTMNITFSSARKTFKATVGIGEYKLPAVNDFKLNKYGMPSYRQANINLQYSLDKIIKGASIQALVAHKSKTGDDLENSKNIINKVDMTNLNLVLNYTFDSH